MRFFEGHYFGEFCNMLLEKNDILQIDDSILCKLVESSFTYIGFSGSLVEFWKKTKNLVSNELTQK